MIAWGSRNAHLVFLHIKDESVLTHKCASHENFVSPIEFLYSKAVLVLLMSVEILTGVPFQLDFRVVDRVSMEIEDRKTHKV